jgi:DOMON domain
MKMGMYRRVSLLALKMNLILWDSFIFVTPKFRSSFLLLPMHRYIYAYGSTNDLGYHAARGQFSASLQGAPAVGDDAEAPAPAPGAVSTLELEEGLTLQTVDNGDNTATFTLVYDGEGWVALGVSPTGVMIGSQAVIGLPGSDPVIYTLGAKDTAGVVPAASDQQILTSSSVTQVDGITTLTFTVPFDSDTLFSISPSDENGYV